MHKTVTTRYVVQLGLAVKGYAIKEFFVCRKFGGVNIDFISKIWFRGIVYQNNTLWCIPYKAILGEVHGRDMWPYIILFPKAFKNDISSLGLKTLMTFYQ